MAISFNRRSQKVVVPLPVNGLDQKEQAVSRVQPLAGRGNPAAIQLLWRAVALPADVPRNRFRRSSSLRECCRRVRWNESGMPARHEYLEHRKMSQ